MGERGSMDVKLYIKKGTIDMCAWFELIRYMTCQGIKGIESKRGSMDV